MVTGASDGLGKEYAIQLAQKGFNLLLVSRTEPKLKALEEELMQKYVGAYVQTKILAMDFSLNREEDYAKLQELIDELDIGILVNTVGQSHSIPVPFAITDKKEIDAIVQINIVATLRVTQMILPGMLRRRKGLILTMGSFAAWMPTPLLATYAGSKAFLQQWSTALGGELKGSGIDVQLVLSYLVTTAMSKVRRTSSMIPNPRTYVRAVMSKVGRSGGIHRRA